MAVILPFVKKEDREMGGTLGKAVLAGALIVIFRPMIARYLPGL